MFNTNSTAGYKLLFSIMPSGRMFGDRVRGKSRKYLASQTFAASYPALDRWNRVGSVLLWLLVFGCKFTESYFYLTRSFSYPIQVMVGMKIQGCTEKSILVWVVVDAFGHPPSSCLKATSR
jgi:1,3-beta-glucan synthase